MRRWEINTERQTVSETSAASITPHAVSVYGTLRVCTCYFATLAHKSLRVSPDESRADMKWIELALSPFFLPLIQGYLRHAKLTSRTSEAKRLSLSYHSFHIHCVTSVFSVIMTCELRIKSSEK